VDAANLFLTNPVLNDYDRIWEAAQQHGARALFKTVFEGPLPLDVVDNTDVKKILEYEQAGNKIVYPNPMPAKILETKAVGTAAQDIGTMERAAQAAEARDHLLAGAEGALPQGVQADRRQHGLLRAGRIHGRQRWCRQDQGGVARHQGLAGAFRDARDAVESFGAHERRGNRAHRL
jgi:hypothetical protein